MIRADHPIQETARNLGPALLQRIPQLGRIGDYLDHYARVTPDVEAAVRYSLAHGAEKVVRNYNVMGVAKAALECSTRYLADDLGLDGIRVNSISAGPVKTLAAAGIKGMRTMLSENADRTPLRRNIEHDDVARAALYLCSDLAKNVTGEVLHVDAGQNIVGTVSMG